MAFGNSVPWTLYFGVGICLSSTIAALCVVPLDRRAEERLVKMGHKSKKTGVDAEEQIHFREVKDFQLSFWLLTISCVVMYACKRSALRMHARAASPFVECAYGVCPQLWLRAAMEQHRAEPDHQEVHLRRPVLRRGQQELPGTAGCGAQVVVRHGHSLHHVCHLVAVPGRCHRPCRRPRLPVHGVCLLPHRRALLHLLHPQRHSRRPVRAPRLPGPVLRRVRRRPVAVCALRCEARTCLHCRGSLRCPRVSAHHSALGCCSTKLVPRTVL